MRWVTFDLVICDRILERRMAIIMIYTDAAPKEYDVAMAAIFIARDILLTAVLSNVIPRYTLMAVLA
jgi:hypothetical protein